MEFIKAEEFLKQPVEVQKVFLEWWKPSVGDLYIDDVENMYLVIDGQTDQERWNRLKTRGDIIPLLSEGQLRQFIEDYFNKSDSKVELEWCNDGYTINIVSKINDEKVFREFSTSETEPIQAYWKVATQISKEASN